MSYFEDEDLGLTLTDLKRVYARHRARIKKIALFSGLAVFFFLLFSAPEYQTEATFKLASNRSEASLNMKEIFQRYMALPAESATAAVMQSSEVLKPALEAQGMQVHCEADFFLVRALKRAWRNAALEMGFSPSSGERFSFRNVVYLGEKPLKLYVSLKETGMYELTDRENKSLGVAKLGDSIDVPMGKLTLAAAPVNAKVGRTYSLVVNPWVETVRKLRKKLKIFPHKLDKSILQLRFQSPDRFAGAAFLNHLMGVYQNFLKRENDELCQKQLDYLQSRQEELTTHYDAALAEHASYLKENIDENGFIGFAQEIETLSAPRNLYTSRLFDVDLELHRLARENRDAFFAAEQSAKKTKVANKGRQKGVKKVGAEHALLTEKVQVLQLRLDDCELEQIRCLSSAVLPIHEEIVSIEKQIGEAGLLLESLEQQRLPPETPSLLKDPKSAVALLARQIASALEKEGEPLPRDQYASYLLAMIEQLGKKRQALLEDLELQETGLDEFSGLNLPTAQGLLVEYTRQRDSLQAQMRELVFLRDQVGMPDFEVSSLGGVFDDGVTRDLVNRASQVALQLKDENNRSPREQQRLAEALETQKSFLSEYLLQTVELKKLHVRMLTDKIASLQKGTLSLLETEKGLLKDKLHELNVKMSVLPDRWRRESLLSLKKELGAMMLEGIFQLTESKYLDQNIFQAASRPLDRALVPVKPKLPKLFLFSLGATVFAGMIAFLVIFSKSAVQGLPVSDQTLKKVGLPVSGRFSPHCPASLAQFHGEDLETLRQLAKFIAAHKREGEGASILCIGGKYPDFSTPLAELLGMQGLRSIVVHSVFDKVVRPDDVPGLWQYLQQQTHEIPRRCFLTHDFIPSGGTSRHGLEAMMTPRFETLLSRLKQKYDVVLLYSSADAAAAEGTSLLRLADAAIVTTQMETKEHLVPYREWMELKGAGTATFVYAVESLT